jgi:hypothetical protein
VVFALLRYGLELPLPKCTLSLTKQFLTSQTSVSYVTNEIRIISISFDHNKARVIHTSKMKVTAFAPTSTFNNAAPSAVSLYMAVNAAPVRASAAPGWFANFDGHASGCQCVSCGSAHAAGCQCASCGSAHAAGCGCGSCVNGRSAAHAPGCGCGSCASGHSLGCQCSNCMSVGPLSVAVRNVSSI